jgi:hypothetical protein
MHAGLVSSALNQRREFPVFIPGTGVLKCKAGATTVQLLDLQLKVCFRGSSTHICIEAKERVFATGGDCDITVLQLTGNGSSGQRLDRSSLIRI